MVVYRFVWELNQISWLPAAWRSKANPQTLDSDDFLVAKTREPSHQAAITIV